MIPSSPWQDHQYVMATVKEKGLSLVDAHPSLRADREIVMAAVKQTGFALTFAAPCLLADKEVVMAAVKKSISGRISCFTSSLTFISTFKLELDLTNKFNLDLKRNVDANLKVPP